MILSGIYQTLFNAAIKIGILLLVLPFVGVHPGWGGLLIPVGVLALVLTGTALGLAVTPLGVLYGDIGRGMGLITQFLMYLSPVVFPLAASGWTAYLMRLNPLTPLILNARAWFTGQPPPVPGRMAAHPGRLRLAAADDVDGVSAGDADPDRADERLRHGNEP